MIEWRFIPGFDKDYLVSDQGEVKSNKSRTNSLRGTIIKQQTDREGRKSLTLWHKGEQHTVGVHRLVALAFLGEPPTGRNLVRHLDGNPSNNASYNLAWGSQKDNMADAIRHGTLRNTKKTECPKGHPYDRENTYKRPGNPNHRQCKKCIDIRNQKAKKPPFKPPLVHASTAGYSRGCRCEPCKEAMRAYWLLKARSRRGKTDGKD